MGSDIASVLDSCLKGRRISVDDSISLFQHASLAELGVYADRIKHIKNGQNVYFVKNYHIEPTNVCVFQCKFCSFSVTDKSKGWSKSQDEIISEVQQLDDSVKEIHIVGGSNPEYNVTFYSELLKKIKNLRPDVHIKAFTAAEIFYMSELSGENYERTLSVLKDSGLDSMPGGGAEIFDDGVRKQICPDKIKAGQWIDIHRSAHKLGIRSNATMLFGHLENGRQRFEHMNALRQLQDETGGFNAFIPLKYRNMNNALSNISETRMIEDLKMFALSRLFFDNIEHLKVYWPAFGKQFAAMAISFGADDLDGTIDNSTKIYSMAGAGDTSPVMTMDEAEELICHCGYIPVERDAMYQHIPKM